ncbi:hypothetical protein GCM10007418_21940 [Halopseudomonas salina]|uniref:Uncharacterized protein n=1 Tax=Halopseudomonas salina TaxID=1323744 RepID=A0ABQ1PS20_9GAMM|nr:hypothetical protein GCM10007418_21940 [Halopseudomonas salina]
MHRWPSGLRCRWLNDRLGARFDRFGFWLRFWLRFRFRFRFRLGFWLGFWLRFRFWLGFWLRLRLRLRLWRDFNQLNCHRLRFDDHRSGEVSARKPCHQRSMQRQ